MSGWTSDELHRIGRAEEVEITSLRRDGTPRNPVTVWLVRQGDALYVGSAVRGRRAAWFRGVEETHKGRIRAGGVINDVTFEDADRGLAAEIDDAYRIKYRRYTGKILDTCLTPDARSTTLRRVPRASL
ncbi:MAG TPA: DUF2255 family protein [Candidatus Dormibacteraeota bacterium]|jgi:hypothetical protein|nr:DUF2255 family protein [Candidatus Dormibacteraeota bacterium]